MTWLDASGVTLKLKTGQEDAMREDSDYRGGENFDLRQMLLKGRSMRLEQKAAFFGRFLEDLAHNGENLCMRCITSPADREVVIADPATGRPKTMIMFGSNNYLGLANHPVVTARVEEAIRSFGIGVGGPPLLNGYTALHNLLERRLAALKGTEDALVFSSGYGANVGLVSGLMTQNDVVIYDAYSHASFCDGIKMSGAQGFRFPHNDVVRLEALLRQKSSPAHDTYVGVEGVYSMDGDLAPLDKIVELCEAYGAILIVDDAHGTGVMGSKGSGTAEHFGVEGRVPITMGTFSKAFAVTGAFVAGPQAIISYLRFFARSYMFSASLPPMVLAAVLGGLDVLQAEPRRLVTLRENVAYAAAGLNEIGIHVRPEAAIIPLIVPAWMSIRQAGRKFHERGIFVNSVEYPAVPISQQRFRISMMATHTRDDIDTLLDTVAAVWKESAHSAEPHDASLQLEAA
jgi:glycine C-acetyltransferase